MRIRNVPGLVVTAVVVSMAFLGSSAASATGLCEANTGTTICSEGYPVGTVVDAILSGGSSIIENLSGTVIDECSGSTFKGKSANAGSTSETVTIPMEAVTWSGCTKATSTVALGSFEVHWISGTDNATLTASRTEWTTNTIFGSCIYGFGENKDLGTITGGSPATLAINTNVAKTGGNASCLSETRWTASYKFTEPEPLYFSSEAVEPPKPSGVLCRTNSNTTKCPESYGSGRAVEGTLTAGSTAKLSTLGGTLLDTCTVSTLKGKVSNAGGSTEAAKASIESLAWGPVGEGCTKTTDTVKVGSVEFRWISGTDNATLTASSTEWTTNTIFGSCIYGTGKTLDLGTVSGGSPAVITINTNIVKQGGNVACPAEARWEASYTFTAPKPLYFAKESEKAIPPGGGVLCKTNTNTALCPESYGVGQSIEASLSETAKLSTLGGTLLDTCTVSTLKGKVTEPGGPGKAVEASIEELTWGPVGEGCTKTTDTISTGSLDFQWIEGTDNGTLTASGVEWTTNTIFGSCIYGSGASKDLGTITGGSPATLAINTNITKTGGNALCPAEARWEASYTFTAPKPLYFAES